jgi:hypothetical protein
MPMTDSTHPFAVPAALPQAFDYVRSYWEGLRRAGNEIPFWDDMNLSAMPDLSDRLLLMDAFENPQRFRLNTLGEKVKAQSGTHVTGKFVDEIEPKAPFEFLTAQASVTIEAKAPTFFHHNPLASTAYGRLLLPMWGNGRIEMMLGLVAEA